MMVLFVAIDACFPIQTPGTMHAIVWASRLSLNAIYLSS